MEGLGLRHPITDGLCRCKGIFSEKNLFLPKFYSVRSVVIYSSVASSILGLVVRPLKTSLPEGIGLLVGGLLVFRVFGSGPPSLDTEVRLGLLQMETR